MPRLNCFIDESGQDNMSSNPYLVTLLFHHHSLSISKHIKHYEAVLRDRKLPDIPFHMVDLLHGHGKYSGLSPEVRKPLLYSFASFVQNLPISYVTLVFESNEIRSKELLEGRIQREISSLLLDHLDRFQEFDKVVVYYDQGSSVVARATKASFETVLSSNTLVYKEPLYSEKRLLQVTDYLTSVELASIRFENNEQSKTYSRFFGSNKKFKRNLLKSSRRLKLS